jgi:hypothetical protein
MGHIKKEEMKILKKISKNLLENHQKKKEVILHLKQEEKIILEDKILVKIKEEVLEKDMIIKKVL